MHLGKSETAPDREIVGIFDIEKATLAADTRDFLRRAQEGYRTVNLATDLPAAFVLRANALTDSVYLTAISADALKKRGGGILKRGAEE